MIDYSLLHKSFEYYQSKGFQRIESPWTVSKKVDDITKPEERLSFQLKHNDKCLVGSGEQSFLYLYLKGFLPKGKFQTITPCFRFEAFDFLHTKYFMKNELIQTDEVDHTQLLKVVDISLEFFRSYFPEAKVMQTCNQPMEQSYDIEIDGIELGSYGIRKCDFLVWIYGTGCAEPRMSSLMRKYGIS